MSVSRGGIPKLPLSHTRMTARGLDGDRHAHPQYHWGPRQAVLWITSEGNAELAELGFPIHSGTLGENITSEGINRREWRSGQRWRMGPEAIVELTKLREPCKTLLPLGAGIHAAVYDAAAKGGDAASPRWGLGGFYAAVIVPGSIHPGDEIRLVG